MFPEKGSFYHYFPSKEYFFSAVKNDISTRKWHARPLCSGRVEQPLQSSVCGRYFEELTSVYGPEGDRRHRGCLLGNLSQEMANHSDLIQQALQEGFRIWQGAIEVVSARSWHARGELSPRRPRPRRSHPSSSLATKARCFLAQKSRKQRSSTAAVSSDDLWELPCCDIVPGSRVVTDRRVTSSVSPSSLPPPDRPRMYEPA